MKISKLFHTTFSIAYKNYDCSQINLKFVLQLNLDRNKRNILLGTAENVSPDNNKWPRTLKRLTKIISGCFGNYLAHFYGLMKEHRSSINEMHRENTI